MKQISVTKSDMAVIRRDRLRLSPFALLALAFQDEIASRRGWQPGWYREVPLTLREDGESETAAPKPAPIHLDVNLSVVLETLKKEQKKEKNREKQAAERILERVYLLERQIEQTRISAPRLTVQLGMVSPTSGGAADLSDFAPSGHIPDMTAQTRIRTQRLLQTQQPMRLPAVGRAPGQPDGLLTGLRDNRVRRPTDLRLRPQRALSAQLREVRRITAPLQPVLWCTAAPAGTGWTPQWQAEHPGFPQKGAEQRVAVPGYSILLPDALRRRREQAIQQASEQLVWSDGAQAANVQTRMAEQITRAVERTLRQHTAQSAPDRPGALQAQDRLQCEREAETSQARAPCRKSTALPDQKDTAFASNTAPVRAGTPAIEPQADGEPPAWAQTISPASGQIEYAEPFVFASIEHGAAVPKQDGHTADMKSAMFTPDVHGADIPKRDLQMNSAEPLTFASPEHGTNMTRQDVQPLCSEPFVFATAEHETDIPKQDDQTVQVKPQASVSPEHGADISEQGRQMAQSKLLPFTSTAQGIAHATDMPKQDKQVVQAEPFPFVPPEHGIDVPGRTTRSEPLIFASTAQGIAHATDMPKQDKQAVQAEPFPFVPPEHGADVPGRTARSEPLIFASTAQEMAHGTDMPEQGTVPRAATHAQQTEPSILDTAHTDNHAMPRPGETAHAVQTIVSQGEKRTDLSSEPTTAVSLARLVPGRMEQTTEAESLVFAPTEHMADMLESDRQTAQSKSLAFTSTAQGIAHTADVPKQDGQAAQAEPFPFAPPEHGADVPGRAARSEPLIFASTAQEMAHATDVPKQDKQAVQVEPFPLAPPEHGIDVPGQTAESLVFAPAKRAGNPNPILTHTQPRVSRQALPTAAVLRAGHPASIPFSDTDAPMTLVPPTLTGTHTAQVGMPSARPDSRSLVVRREMRTVTQPVSMQTAQLPPAPATASPDALAEGVSLTHLALQTTSAAAQAVATPHASDANSLPEWAQRFLQQGAADGAGARLSDKQLPAPQAKPAGGTQIAWTAPGAVRRPANIVYRTDPPKEARQTAAAAPVMSEGELRRTADKVYRIIEERLRREMRRSGR